jgi:hypothetical protein
MGFRADIFGVAGVYGGLFWTDWLATGVACPRQVFHPFVAALAVTCTWAGVGAL